MTEKSIALTKDDKRIIRKSYFWNIAMFASSDPIVQYARGLALSIKPGLDIWLKDDPEEYRQTFMRHCEEFFNTNFTMQPLISGVVLAMEKERALHKEIDSETISSVKASLMGPTAGIGDSLFFNCLRVIVAGIAINLSAGGNILGPLFFIVFYAGTRMLCAWLFLNAGYKYGATFVTKAFASGLMNIVTEAACTVGAIMVGALIATNVKINIAFAPNLFGAVVEFQAILDEILPGVLSLVAMYLAYKSLKKGMSPIVLIFVIIGICILLSLLGIV